MKGIIRDLFGIELNIKADKGFSPETLPEHIAIIMDGNGRWAGKRHVPRIIGHREGALTLKRIVLKCGQLGIKYLTVYAFSTENWKRPRAEVDALMELLREFLSQANEELAENNIKIKVLGDINRLPKDIRNEIIKVEKSTEENTGLWFNIALNYGSRNEIVNAVKAVCKDVEAGEFSRDDITEEVLSNYMYTRGIPDPDLLIRTSGENRLSNFLLWQLDYSELYFVKLQWHDFSEKHLIKAIEDYMYRERRFGGI